MFGWGETGEDETFKNVIFHCLVRVKKESKEKKVDGVFHPSPFFLSPN